MHAKVGDIPERGSMLTPIRALVLSAEKMLVFMKRNSRILFLGLMCHLDQNLCGFSWVWGNSNHLNTVEKGPVKLWFIRLLRPLKNGRRIAIWRVSSVRPKKSNNLKKPLDDRDTGDWSRVIWDWCRFISALIPSSRRAHSAHPQCAVLISTFWERTASKVTVSPLSLSLFLSFFLEIYCISVRGLGSSLLFLLFSSWGKGATL